MEGKLNPACLEKGSGNTLWRQRPEKIGVKEQEWEVAVCGEASQEDNVINPGWWCGGVSFPLSRANVRMANNEYF